MLGGASQQPFFIGFILGSSDSGRRAGRKSRPLRPCWCCSERGIRVLVVLVLSCWSFMAFGLHGTLITPRWPALPAASRRQTGRLPAAGVAAVTAPGIAEPSAGAVTRMPPPAAEVMAEPLCGRSGIRGSGRHGSPGRSRHAGAADPPYPEHAGDITTGLCQSPREPRSSRRTSSTDQPAPRELAAPLRSPPASADAAPVTPVQAELRRMRPHSRYPCPRPRH